jgi:catechol 2,3-dioxygenase-like lactoylglutathione lyase family enzyme
MLVGLGVVAVLMAVIFVVQALSSDSRAGVASSSSDGKELIQASTAQDLGLATTLPSETATTTIVIQGPPRVSIYGDSLASGFGGLLKSTLDRQGVTTFLATHGSSGLSQPGFFDWPNHLNVWVPQENAGVVVIGLGANDGQDVKAMFDPVLELTHNHGTENDDDFKHFNGNEQDRQGFGHIGFLVDDVNKGKNVMNTCMSFTVTE